MNREIRSNFISDLKKFPNYHQKFENFVLNRKIVDLDQIDFINDRKAFEFINLKMYTRMEEIDDYEDTELI
jgi:hypothetical protein